MPTTLVLTFPLGRYHATPWDRHVNEGAVELPPSPWRLLRALYAVWQTRCADLPEPVVHGLLNELAEPPSFYVPPHTLSHTRHYYPDTGVRHDRALDTFAVFGPSNELAITWQFEFEPERHDAFERLARALPYFGRADSICDGRLETDWSPTGHALWVPEGTDDSATTLLLGPDGPLRIDSLLARPVDVRRSGQRLPEGTRYIPYRCNRNAEIPGTGPLTKRSRAVTGVRFDLLQPTLPPDTDTAIYTDLLRQAAISKLGSTPEGTMLGGRTSDNQPMQNGGHAHYLPVINDRSITGLVVWIPGGLPDKEVDALCNVADLRGYKHRARLRVSGIGNIHHIAPEITRATDKPNHATIWRSVTPFTPSRHPRRHDNWHKFITREIERELSHGPGAAPPSVEFIHGSWNRFVRYRPTARNRPNHKQGRTGLPAEFLRLHFDTPVIGPITLGRLNHFGLGLFIPEN